MARPRARSLIWRILLALAALLAVGGAAGALLFYVTFLADLPDFRTLRDYQPMLTSVVLDREGRPVGEFYEHRRRLTQLEEIPRHVVDSFLAAEDDTFFEHEGIDYVSIARAAWANLRAGGEVRQGASTITQQMVKQLLLSPERSVRRKVREMVLARRIEQRFTKEEILYLYLNQIYFGSGAYGIGEAARTYFGKEVGELTVGESALLAGLPKAPSRNSPFVNPERAEERRRYVLDRMVEEGMIDEATWKDARANPPALGEIPEADDYRVAAYFTEEVRKTLFDRLGGERVLSGGLVVETTLDLELQRAAVASLREGLENLDRRQGWTGPVRSVEPPEIAAELERVAVENELVPGGEGEAEAPLPVGRPLQGVVVSIDEKANRARIAFAPGRELPIEHDVLRWARRRNLRSYPYEIEKITTALKVGDVDRFRIEELPALGGEADEAAAEPAPPPEPRRRVVLAQTPLVQGALLSIEVKSGDVLAMVGGYDFEASEFNRAVQAERQPGSAFKPLVYAAALDRGFTAASIVHDRPVVYDDASGTTWRPQNYGRKFLGPITLREALARSVNNATIHLMREVGVEHVVDFAKRLGIRSTLEPNLSLALGSYPVTLLEMTRAYAVFANDGYPVRGRFIRRVLDRDGHVILEDLALGESGDGAADVAAAAPTETEPEPEESAAPELAVEGEAAGDGTYPEEAGVPWGEDGRLIPSTQAFLAGDLLRGVVEHPKGTGGRARSLGRPIGGKTGTTNAQGDAWFLGFSPEIATGVWVGFDSKEVLGKGETGGRAALPIWLEYMKAALADRPPSEFSVPEGIVFARIDPATGLLATAADPGAYFQPFVEGTEPRRSAAAALDPEQRRRLERLDF